MDNSLIQVNRRLLLISLIVAGVYFARPFLVPLAIGSVLATLFLPLCKWFEARGFAPALAATCCVVVLLAAVAAIVSLLGWQVTEMAGDIVRIRQGLNRIITNVQDFIFRHFNVSGWEQEQILKEEQPRLGTLVKAAVGSVSDILYQFILVAVYVMLFLYYRLHVRGFVLRLFNRHQRYEVDAVLNNIAQVSQQYLLGLSKMIVCLWVMYGVGFSLLGVENALFFAFLCGLLEIVPFVGNITGTTITVLVTAAQGAPFALLAGIVLVYGFIQFIQGWLLEPLIVGPQVKVNPLATILALVLGELLWGLAGVFLAIPIAAMLKILCDHIEPLKPIGFLLGNKVKALRSRPQPVIKTSV
ncbi:MAG: AI-2E family transporter [Taibaiella sp.]|nr:AI-2E family transporter [Taibaiella sp.]